MGKYRPPSEKSKYYIPKEDYLTAVHYALRYPLWQQDLRDMANTSKGISYDKDKVQTSNEYDSTFEAAVRISESYPMQKTKMIDDIIALTARGMDEYLRKGVCYGMSYYQLRNAGMPCGKDLYSLIRQHFYYELSKQI